MLKVLHQQILHSDIFTVVIWLLSYCLLAEFRGLWGNISFVFGFKTLMSWSLSHGTASPQVADGETTS
jgi:hypothetical protein